MSFDPLDYLRHVLAEADYLVEQSEGLGNDQFLWNATLRRAFVRSLEVIDEAAKNVPRDFRERHPQIEWHAMAGMRDRLIHGYFGVDYDLVWDVVAHKVPGLRLQVQEILRPSAEPPGPEGGTGNLTGT